MSGVDNRVVNMQFNNSQFQRGIQTTLDSLAQLNKGLKLEAGAKGLNEVSNAAKGFSLAGIASSVDQIASKFSTMSVIAIAAIQRIVSRAVDAGISLVHSLTVEPITAGLHEYETNLNSIQTILSNTQWENVGLTQVNAALQELNLYSDKTIYNFAEMARNIGTFTAAGVKLDVSVNAIKGIANLAAVSGSSSLQASTAMYQLSQALATGTVKLMDWNSVVNAGMGGKVFQDALKETARLHGVAIDKIIKDEGSFRDSLQKGWLTSQILTETLAKFTGDLSASQLKAMGYNEQQIAGILKLGKTAQDAATKVKTVSQLIDTLQEAVGSGWSQTWQILFGDFEEAKSLFTGISNVLGGFINASANARNKVLGDWKALGGRTALIDSVANAFNALISVIKPIKDAFRAIFPPTTGKQLYDITTSIRDFTKGLKIGGETADNLRRTFAGLFAVLDIVWQVVKQVTKTFFSLFDGAGQGASSFLKVTAAIGDFLVNLDKAIKNGDDLTNFFDTVGKVIRTPIKYLGQFVSLLVDLAKNIQSVDPSNVAKTVSHFEAFGKLGNIISAVWSRILGILGAVAKAFGPLALMFGDFFSKLGQVITDAMGTIDYNSVLDALNTGLLAGIALLLKKFLSNGINVDVGGGILGNIRESFEALTGTMQAMQAQLKANTLIKIAGAVALLTASVVALSLIDSGKLTVALAAMAAMFTQLMASMVILQKVTASKGFVKMPVLTSALILLAIAVDLLTIAVSRLAALDWNSLVKGLTGVGILLGELSVSAKIISGSSKGLVTAGAGFVLLAAAINILVRAVSELSGLSWKELAKGLVGVATLLVSLALFTKFSDVGKAGVLQGAGIVLLAAGIKILASAMTDIAKLSWEAIAKGLAATAGSLLLFAVALNAIPPTSVLSAAAIFVAAASLGMLGDAIAKMGVLSWESIAKGLVTLAGAFTAISLALALLPPTSLLSAAAIFVVASSLGMIVKALGTAAGMSWGDIAKGLVTLAGSLAIIAIAMGAMTTALPGAAALLVVAASLKILTPILITLGGMSLGEIAKGLLTLAGVFAVLGLAGAVLTPLVPTLLGLGAAITLIGVGVLAAGVGVLAFSAALTALSIAGAAGTAALVAMVTAILGLIPLALKEIGLGIIAFADVIATGGPAITKALVTVLMSLLNAIATLTPKIISTLFGLLTQMLNAMVKYVPIMTDAGFKIIIGFLQGIANNIGRVVTTATNVIVNFLNGISKNIGRVTDAGVKVVISFVNGLANAINRNTSAMRSAGLRLAVAIVDGMTGGLASAVSRVAGAAARLAKSAYDAARHALGVHSPSKAFFSLGVNSGQGMINGVDSMASAVAKSSENVGKAAILAMSKSIAGMSDLIGGEINVNPTITPVLDLSNVKKNASKISSMFGLEPINVGFTTQQANIVAASYTPPETSSVQPAPVQSTTLEFKQYNTSPKALSSAEIYRQTNNQLSVAKGALP